MSTSSSKLIILDRDGVINEDSDEFVKSVEEWIPLPGSLEAIALLNQAGYQIAIATNQSGLSRGYFTISDLHAMHNKMDVLLKPLGGRIDSIFFCPHQDSHQCDCRKPAPGMMKEIALRYKKIDSVMPLTGVPIVGDSLRDLEAGVALGATPHLVLTGKGERTLAKGRLPEGTQIHADLIVVFTPIWSVLCMIAFPFLSPENRYTFIGLWNKIVIALLKPLCGIHYEIRGMENMQAVLNERVIILSKHQSAYETIAYIALLPKQLCFVFKRELLWIPFFGWALALLKMIHINRSNKQTAAHSVATQGRKRLSEGKWIMLFPEGTRTPTGSNKPYRKGGARLASATDALVIPIAHNAGRCWPKNSFIKEPGTVIFSIGPAIRSSNKSAEELQREVEGWIEAEMRVIDPSAYK